jgi:hypothetical protein
MSMGAFNYICKLADACNARDLEGALRLFSLDAQVLFPGQSPERYDGPDERRSWLESDFAAGLHVHVGARSFDSPKVAVARCDVLCHGLMIHGSLEVHTNGKDIVLFRFSADDESLEKMRAAMAQHIENGHVDAPSS